ncbi:MAG: hypothetical protein HC927_13120 [Deltaproteobacteria bacterium]|nr:hypothetical protein [Deltaproteobacteria bacterium]
MSAALAFTGFEELAHTPDVRRFDGGVRGRYGIDRTGIHVYRMRALELRKPTLRSLGSGKFTFDPSGRDVPLFQPANRPTVDQWTRPREWQMPKALSCRLIGNAEFEWTEQMVDDLDPPLTETETVTWLKKFAGYRVPDERELGRLNEALPTPMTLDELLALAKVARVADCGQTQLYGSALSVGIDDDNAGTTALEPVSIGFANLETWNYVLNAVKQMAIDPTRGRALIALGDTPALRVIALLLHYGTPAEIGAGSYDRRFDIIANEAVNILDNDDPNPGPVTVNIPSAATVVDEIEDSKTYNPVGNGEGGDAGNLVGLVDYRLQAANLQRPYLLRVTDSEPLEWSFIAHPKNLMLEEDPRCLVLEGLWIGIEHSDPENTATSATLAIEGVWDRVIIRHCTLDPGGEMASVDGVSAGKPIPCVTLEIRDFVEELIIESSITGPIVEAATGNNPATVGKIIIRDSIVGNAAEYGIAINTQLGTVELERCTVVGHVVANRLYASDTFIAGTGQITDLQHGCFRFSTAIQGKWPHPFESHIYPSFSAIRNCFVSSRFGDPGYYQLSELCPTEIRRGAENHSEMGAFNKLFDPIKRDDLRTKIDEFMPFDLIDQLDIEN